MIPTLYDYDEGEQSRNGAKNLRGYFLMPKQNDTASAPATRLRLMQRLRGNDPSELHPLIFLETLLVGVFVYISTADVYHPGHDAAITVRIIVGILLIAMLFIPFLGPLIRIAFSLLQRFLGYALGSSLIRDIGPVNSMTIGGVVAFIGFSVSLKTHLS